MTPQKLLTYLPHDLVEPITRDVAQATAWQMLGPDKHVHEILTARVPAMQAAPDRPSRWQASSHPDLCNLSV
jgi:hypothetical protein